MTELLEKTFYHNTIMQWSISIGIVIASFIISKSIYWVIKKLSLSVFSKTQNQFDDIIINTLEKPAIFSIVIGGFYYGCLRLTFPKAFDLFLAKTFKGMVTIAVAWFLANFVSRVIEHYLIPLAAKSENDLDDQLLPIVKKGLKAGIWVLGIIVALNNAGFDVAALIAGMGIGGLAVAMAAKDTVSNVFGGITVFMDRPFKIGDRIKINGFDGTIVDIGIRSTRLKTLEGRVVTIPNAKFSDGMVENVTLEPTRKVILQLGLTYDTTPENMQKALTILDEINRAETRTDNEHKIAFNSYGDFSLGILFIYYINSGEDILATQTSMNMEILKRFNAEELIFAFPTQTLELTGKVQAS